MRDGSWVDGHRPGAPWLHAEMREVFEGASILLVEDDRDLRELLVDRVRQRLEAEGASRARPARPLKNGGHEAGNGHDNDDCPEPVELILYVSAHSVRSATAIKNIKRALEGQRAGRVTLTICDLSKEPARGQADAVAFTPTLVKRSPGPRTFILGHITSPELVLELLDGCDEGTQG